MRKLSWIGALALAACGGVNGGLPDSASVDEGMAAADLAYPSGTAGKLFLDVTDDESGHSIPARVLFTAVPPTMPPNFDRDAHGKPTNGEVGTSVAPGVIGST